MKIPKQQTTEALSTAAPQSVPDTLACKHPGPGTGTKCLCQLYSIQNLLLSTATFSLGRATEQGQKCQLWMRQQQAGPAWRSQWAECAGLSWSQARASWRHRLAASRGGATSTLPTCKATVINSSTEIKEWQGPQESKVCFQLKI